MPMLRSSDHMTPALESGFACSMAAVMTARSSTLPATRKNISRPRDPSAAMVSPGMTTMGRMNRNNIVQRLTSLVRNSLRLSMSLRLECWMMALRMGRDRPRKMSCSLKVVLCLVKEGRRGGGRGGVE